MITAVCEKTIIILVFPTASKLDPVHIIQLILTTLNNEQHLCKRVRVDEDGFLASSTDVTNLLVDEFNISMETTGGDSSYSNGNNQRQNKIIHNMVREGLIYSDQHKNKW